MYFPQTVEYALRVMAHMGMVGKGGAAVRSQELSEATGIPTAYLSKVLRKLVVGGLLVSQRGHGGGFSLAKSPSRITFAAVMDAVGYDIEPTRCVFGLEKCNTQQPCLLHPAWAQLKEQFVDWARHTTLSDVRRSASGRHEI
jgi:Rrf2 family iron-sulfur cluster assembly transcriptional regulator